LRPFVVVAAPFFYNTKLGLKNDADRVVLWQKRGVVAAGNKWIIET
jgi:hypothetical protein